MAIPALAVIVPLSFVFILSGLVINLIQATCFLVVRPVSKRLYRRMVRAMSELLWLQLVCIVDWWAGVKVQVFADPETARMMGKEHALCVSNHRSDIDWLVGWVAGDRSGCLGSTLGIIKKSSRYLPALGWSMWFSEFVFVERSWDKDENTLKEGLQRFEDYPLPFWFAVYAEGTRFTKAKLIAAQEYAASAGLPIPRNVLIPRTKGFVAAVRHMRSFVPAIYDVTVAIPKTLPPPTALSLIKRQPSVAHIRFKRYSMKDLPESDEEIAQWCRDLYVSKDSLLDKHAAEDTFGDEYLLDTKRSSRSLLVMSFSTCCVFLGLIKFLQWSSLLSTWKGIAILFATLAATVLSMQSLIRYSQSELSTTAMIAPAKQKNAGQTSQSNRKKLH
ncbi:1-acyl-sn-glycerol-3-phosphate acyltransferase 2-like protein [Drosera capensis]